MKDILKDKKKQKGRDFDNACEKIQGQNWSVRGLLLQIWTEVELARLPQSQENSVDVDLKIVQEFAEETVLLLGQAYTPVLVASWFCLQV